MFLIDTHTHLYLENFDSDQNETIERALKLGIKSFFLPAIDSSYTERMFLLKEKYPHNIFLMTGLHPNSVKENFTKELEHINFLLEKNRNDFYAIGEIGIDLYWDTSFFKEQEKAFITQIEWAKKYNLPIVIHSRNSFQQIFKILRKFTNKDIKGIFHCFSGTYEDAQKIIEMGFLLGIGGIVTFKNGKIDTFLSKIPLKNIVLETDSPYLAPVPHRGKRNESAYLSLILEKVATIYGCSIEEVAKCTTENAKNVFKI